MEDKNLNNIADQQPHDARQTEELQNATPQQTADDALESKQDIEKEGVDALNSLEETATKPDNDETATELSQQDEQVPGDEKPSAETEAPQAQEPEVESPVGQAEVDSPATDNQETPDAEDSGDDSHTVDAKLKAEQDELDQEQDELDNMARTVGEEVDEHEEHSDDSDEQETPDYRGFTLEQIVIALEELVKTEDIASIKNKVIKLQTQYNIKYEELRKEQQALFESTKEPESEQSFKFDDGGLSKRFHQAMKLYKQKKEAFIEAQEILKKNNLQRKNQVLEELKQLIEQEDSSYHKIYEEFKNLQEKWRQIGMVPKNEVKNLWMNYNFLVDKFFDKLQIDRELRDIGYRKNLEAKIELCEKAEELLLEKSITKSFKLLQEYHRRWKEIGPVPRDQSDEIWQRFKNATSRVNARRREYYEKLTASQEDNLKMKLELCDQAEAVANGEYERIKEWNLKTKEMEELFARWRKIGRAPEEQNDEVWNRFKHALNSFYKNKRQFYNTLKEEQQNNLNIKLDICKSAEALKDSTDWKKTTKELIRLQKEWKMVGPVPRKHSDQVWKRFRAACDHFFNAKEEFYKNIKDVEKQNLEKKNALLEQLKTMALNEDKEEALKQIKDIQKQWIECNPVPRNKKDALQRDFRTAVDEKLASIGLSAVDIELMKIKERIGNSEDKKETEYVLRKEISSIQFKIQSLKTEIVQLENNMGFFASSKNADALKKEIEGKIDKAKSKIASLEARYRQLDKTLRVLRQGE